jgi:hypothetical protein
LDTCPSQIHEQLLLLVLVHTKSCSLKAFRSWFMYSKLVLQSSEQKRPALLLSADMDVKKSCSQLTQ